MPSYYAVRVARCTNPDPRANAAQFFQRNRPLRVFGLCNKLLADTVIFVCLKPTLASGQLLQATFGRLGADRLPGGAAASTALPDTLNHSASMCLAIGIRGNVGDAQINSQNTFYVDWRRLLNLGSWNQIPTPLDASKITLTDAPVEQFALTGAAHKGDGLPPTDCPDRNGGLLIRQNALIKRDCTKWLKNPLRLLVEFVSVGDFRNTTHNQLRTQTSLLTNIVIGQAVDVELLKRTQIPGYLADLVARGVGCFKRLLEQVSLFRCWLELKLYGKSHIMIIPQIEHMHEKAKAAKAVRFLPRLKLVGFRA